MELRTSGLAVTSFLEVMQHFLWCISPPNLPALSVNGVQCNRSTPPHTHTVYLDLRVFALRLPTHPLSGQSHCTTGSWWHPGRQTFQWQSLTRCTNGKLWTSSPVNQHRTIKYRKTRQERQNKSLPVWKWWSDRNQRRYKLHFRAAREQDRKRVAAFPWPWKLGKTELVMETSSFGKETLQCGLKFWPLWGSSWLAPPVYQWWM